MSTFTTSESICAQASEAAGGTPFYLASPAQLRANMTEAAAGFARLGEGSRLAYSVKSNYLSAFIRTSADAGHLTEVVSANEYALAIGLGVQETDIIVNGPGKTVDFMTSAALAGAMVNLDSMEEARALHSWARTRGGIAVEVGIRVAAQMADGHTSRFGIDVNDPVTSEELRQLLDGSAMRCTALHIHHSSRRDAESFAERVRALASAARILGASSLERFDIGGGFASDPPPEIRAKLSYRIDPIRDCVDAAAEALVTAFPDAAARPNLVIEPGLGVLADTMVYVCRVVAIKRLDDRWAVITDGSMFEVNPFRGAVGPPTGPLNPRPYDGPTAHRTEPATIYGSTCMEIDQLGQLDNAAGINVGDFIISRNVGAYALSLSPEFIFQRAAVVCADTGALLRERQQLGFFAGGGS